MREAGTYRKPLGARLDEAIATMKVRPLTVPTSSKDPGQAGPNEYFRTGMP